MGDIDSESKFIWKFIFKIILTPITLFLIIIKKKEFKELFEPFRMFFNFISQAKATLSLIIILILTFIASQFLSPGVFDSLVNYPADMFSLKFYTLISSGFLHGSIVHLLGNCLALFVFGRVVERKVGAVKLFLVYAISLVVSNIFSSIINFVILGNNIGGIGASGAIMGVLATAMLLDPFYFTYDLLLPLPIMLVGWIYIFLDFTGMFNADGIGHFAHIGGYLTITVLGFFILNDEKKNLIKGLVINLVSIIILGIIVFITGIYKLI